MVKALADVGDHRLDLISGRVGKREQQTRLASVLGQAGDDSKLVSFTLVDSCLIPRELAAVTERAFASLQAPPQRLTFPDRGMPSSGVLERRYYPTPERIAAAIRGVLAGRDAVATITA